MENPLVVQDEFSSGEIGKVVFHRNANHRVGGLRLFIESVRGLSFEKTK
jgi:hypothetical protein